MIKDDWKGSVCCLDKDNKEQIIFVLGENPHSLVYYSNQKLYFSVKINYSVSLFSFDLETKKSEQIEQIKLCFGVQTFTIVDDFVLFINPKRILFVMNLETKELNDLKISNCNDIHSFEDKVLIQIEEN